MAVVPPLNNFMGPEGVTVTVAQQLLNTEYQSSNLAVQNGFISLGSSELPQLFRVAELGGPSLGVQVLEFLQTLNCFQSPEF